MADKTLTITTTVKSLYDDLNITGTTEIKSVEVGYTFKSATINADGSATAIFGTEIDGAETEGEVYTNFNYNGGVVKDEALSSLT